MSDKQDKTEYPVCQSMDFRINDIIGTVSFSSRAMEAISALESGYFVLAPGIMEDPITRDAKIFGFAVVAREPAKPALNHDGDEQQ